ncbi:MAG: transglycosylase SLT domain-containing protein [Myxococcales bacterium]|nr:transglycosylase SLT domain-containing protein [Myxococcales bacterium]
MNVLAAGVVLWVATASPTPELADYEGRLNRNTRDRYVADLPDIKRKELLRVLTRNNSTGYYISRGEQRGFEYELAAAFARSLGVRVAFVVPETRGALTQALLDGAGDLIAAGMTRTPSRAEKMYFTEPYMSTRRVVATSPDRKKRLDRLEDLGDFTVHISFGSTTLQDARSIEYLIGHKLQLVDVGDGVEMERILWRVARGQYEATIADDVLVGLEQAAGLSIEGRFTIGGARSKAWAVHPASVRLYAAAQRFLAREKRLLRVLKGRYFRPSKTARRARREAYRADTNGRISPYDRLFLRHGSKVGIDWRLLAAVAFVESRFDPEAVSRFGAMGLMQLLPSTAKRVGESRLFDPESNIRAGAKYLKRLMEMFRNEGVEPRQQVRFALAAYNCGLGHVMDARELARRTGRDANKWFDEVEDAMRLKTVPEWHQKTRYGYARAYETISYVSRVQSQYDIFTRHVPLEPQAQGH